MSSRMDEDSSVSVPTFTFLNCPPVPEKIVILLCNAVPNFCLCSLMLSNIHIFYFVSSISSSLHFINLCKDINPSTVGKYLHTLSLHENLKGRNNTSPLYSKSGLTVHFLLPKFFRYQKPTKAKFTSFLTPLYHFQTLFDTLVDRITAIPHFFFFFFFFALSSTNLQLTPQGHTVCIWPRVTYLTSSLTRALGDVQVYDQGLSSSLSSLTVTFPIHFHSHTLDLGTTWNLLLIYTSTYLQPPLFLSHSANSHIKAWGLSTISFVKNLLALFWIHSLPYPALHPDCSSSSIMLFSNFHPPHWPYKLLSPEKSTS